MPVLEMYKAVYYLWKYIPSLAASIIFTIIFLLIAMLQFHRILKHRNWFCLPFAIGCICEVLGYIARALAYNSTSSLPTYVIQSVFLVISPEFYAASIYMTLGRIIRYLKAEQLSIIPVNWLTKIFIIGDLLSLTIQGNASGLLSNSFTAQIGQDIVVAGLFIQLALLIFFFITAIIFQIRIASNQTNESRERTQGNEWKKTLYMVYGVSLAIFVRSVFRVIEYTQGQDGYSMGHEWTLYIFDGVLMWWVAMGWWWWWPGGIASEEKRGEEMGLEL